jgi:hypothetical protein
VLIAPNDPLESTSDFITEDSSSPFNAIDETRSVAKVIAPPALRSSSVEFVDVLS